MPVSIPSSLPCDWHLLEVKLEHESKNSLFSPWSVLAGTVVLLLAAAAAKRGY